MSSAKQQHRDDDAGHSVSGGVRVEWSLAPGDAEAARTIRHAIAGCLRAGATTGSDVDSAEIVVGELLSNVVMHTGAPAKVSLEWAGPHPQVAVTEPSELPLVLPTGGLPDDPLATGGRGLYLVARLAKEMVVDTVGDVRTLRVTLDVDRLS